MSGPHAGGARSVAADHISGTVATGDHARITQVQLPPGGIPAPDQVSGQRVWNVARRRSRVFVGRQADLDQLTRMLDAGGSGVVGQSVAGLGGVGKTELALHHAHGRRDRYQAVWWVTAHSPDSITGGLAALARRLAPTTVVLTDEQAEQWAIAWLQQHRRWLLILDNVDEPAHVEQLVAALDGGHVLVTTRRDVDWARHGLATIRLNVLTCTDAVRMLSERTGQDDTEAAEAIAVELGCLPLALEQAAAYITHHRLSLAGYRTRLCEQPEQVYAGVAPGQDAERAITRVWDLTLAALSSADPVAVEVLAVLAWLDPDDVPRDLIPALTGGDRVAADQALGLLSSHSMITVTGETVSIHRLVQAVLRPSLTTTDATTPASPHERAVRLLADAIPADPRNDPGGWPRWRQLLPHITTLARHNLTGEESATLGFLLNQAVIFEFGQGLHHQALTHATQALALTEAAHGPEHPDVATWLGNLAFSYWDLGRAAEAVPLEQRALRITEAVYGPEHPDVATWLGNLAFSYWDLGRPADAVPLCRRAVAVAVAEESLPTDHPTTTSLRALLEELLNATD